MLRPLTQSAACHCCSFTPFCLLDENSSMNIQEPLVERRLSLHRHETLFLPDNPFEYLYTIEQGALKTYEIEPSGKELIRGFYFVGEVIGCEAIYSGRYQYTATALCDTQVCEIPYNKFLKMLHAKKELQKHILYLLSSQLNMGSYLVSSSAERRLAAFLLDLSTRLHASHVLQFSLPMSRQDIGNYLRLTGETISRICTRLQKNKIIAIDCKKVHLLQLDTLKKIAEGFISIDEAN
jgi:CRP/FNR family transcriptional regulator